MKFNWWKALFTLFAFINLLALVLGIVLFDHPDMDITKEDLWINGTATVVLILFLTFDPSLKNWRKSK